MGMKKIHKSSNVIVSASFNVGHFKPALLKKKDEQMNGFESPVFCQQF